MEFKRANEQNSKDILKLYKSVIGTEFCVWNEFYPTEVDIQNDLQHGNLYVLQNEGEIIGAVSINSENELNEYSCFQYRSAKEIARVVISPAYQGQGLAFLIVKNVLSILWESGVPAVHLSVVKKNIPAYKTYMKLGFTVVGEAEMYGGDYYLMELKL